MTLLLTSSSYLDWVICTAHIFSAVSKRRRRPKLFSLLLRSTFSDFPNSVDGSSINSHSNSDFRCSVNGIKNRRVRAVLFSLLSSSPTFPKVENTNAERHPGSSSFTSKIIVPSSSCWAAEARRKFQQTPSNNSSKLDGISYSYSGT